MTNMEKILGIVRHVFTFGGGFIVSLGLAEASLVQEISGAVLTLIGAIWSIASKK